MAAAKARAVAGKQDGFILAADTVVACGRRILPKADDENDVRACLELLSGRRHQVMTAVALIAPDGKLRTRLVMTRVSFLRLTTDQIECLCAVPRRRRQGGRLCHPGPGRNLRQGHRRFLVQRGRPAAGANRTASGRQRFRDIVAPTAI